MQAQILSLHPIAADGRGSLDGFEARCSCGLRMQTSLSERAMRADAADHLRWHARQKATRR